MAVKMLPQVVANAFVKQYYAILNKCPENVHKFYQESSLLGWPGSDGVLKPVTTLSGINDKIMSSDYKYCSAEIKTTDAQESVEGGVIVAVTGSLTRKDNVKMDFSQTFFLAKQEKGFFVLNDILRVSDVFLSTANAPADYDGINDQHAPSMQSSVHSAVSDSPTSICTKAVENGQVKESFDPPVAKETFAKVAVSTSSVASAEKAPSIVAPASNEKVPSVVAPASDEKVPSVIAPALSEKVLSVAAPASNSTQKITYASMVAKETPAISTRTARVASNVNKQVASPTTKASPPLVDRAPKAATPTSAVPKALAPSNKVSPNPAPPGNGSPNNSAYSEAARGIYIGRLPYDITKQGIVDVLKQFGPVRRNADTIQIRRHEDGFCCGFVEFESADSARRAVEVHHVKFGDKEAYITYKRSYSNRGNNGGGRSPTRAGSRNSNFRGRENQARDNSRFQNENRADHNKGQTRGRRHNRWPSDQWSREASRDR
ncbi:ras GTPase-activating protein-binding protein 1 [Sesamum indicum]|uniref:Ras GTPase-activating protein-binding protein 1 n=1 Tax=Sesamum indicum TaxID=4182 RepID=A0A6I9V208_SESIN|nr:ras GTPase-activating protein-binding protein 1 [Sesamum indicum]